MIVRSDSILCRLCMLVGKIEMRLMNLIGRESTVFINRIRIGSNINDYTEITRRK